MHQSPAASMCWCGPRPRFSWVKMAVGLPEGPSYPAHSPKSSLAFMILFCLRPRFLLACLSVTRPCSFLLIGLQQVCFIRFVAEQLISQLRP